MIDAGPAGDLPGLLDHGRDGGRSSSGRPLRPAASRRGCRTPSPGRRLPHQVNSTFLSVLGRGRHARTCSPAPCSCSCPGCRRSTTSACCGGTNDMDAVRPDRRRGGRSTGTGYTARARSRAALGTSSPGHSSRWSGAASDAPRVPRRVRATARRAPCTLELSWVAGRRTEPSLRADLTSRATVVRDRSSSGPASPGSRPSAELAAWGRRDRRPVTARDGRSCWAVRAGRCARRSARPGGGTSTRPCAGTCATTSPTRRGDARSAPGWWPARVPGSVVIDLWRAGELADPYRARAVPRAEWTAPRAPGCYRRSVDCPPTADGRSARPRARRRRPVRRSCAGTARCSGRTADALPARTGSRSPAGRPGPGAPAGGRASPPCPPNEPQVGRTERVR